MKYYTTYLSINCESPRAGTPMSFNSPDPPFSSHLKRLGAIIQREGGGCQSYHQGKGGEMCFCVDTFICLCCVHMYKVLQSIYLFWNSSFAPFHMFCKRHNTGQTLQKWRLKKSKNCVTLHNEHVWLIRKSMSCAPPLPLLSLRYHQRSCRDQTNGSNRHSRPGENPSYAIETELVL